MKGPEPSQMPDALQMQSNASRQRRIGIFMAASCALLWGFLAIVLKVVSRDVDSLSIVWFRFTFAFVLLAVLVGGRRPASLGILRAPPMLAVLAAIGLTFNYIGYMSGLAMTTPSFAQVLIQVAPLMLAMIGVAFFKERLSPKQLWGVLLALIGFGLFYYDQYQVEVVSHGTLQKGVVVLFAAAVAWALYAALQKVLVMRGCAPQQLNLLFYLFPAIVLVPWVDFETLGALTAQLWGLMAFLGANTLLAYGALGEALARLPAYQVSLILTVNPLITLGTIELLNAWGVEWVPADVVSPVGYGAALLVILGLAVVLKRPAVTKPLNPKLQEGG